MAWDWDDGPDDDEWDDDRPKSKSYKKRSESEQAFALINRMLLGGNLANLSNGGREEYKERLEEIREDLEEAEDEDEIEDALDELDDLKADIEDSWDESWEREWDGIFDLDWDEAFWKGKGLHLPLKVSRSPEVKGKAGEQLVAKYLNELPHNKYHVLNDVLLEIGKTSSQIDHIVVSEYGLFVIETKNYAGVVLGEEHDNRWMQVVGNRKHPFYNPIKQNERHIQVLQQCIHRPIDEFVPMVIFSRNCNLDVNTSTPVLYADTMMDYIRRFDQPIYSDADLIEIEKGIDESWNRSFAARMRHRMRYRFKK